MRIFLGLVGLGMLLGCTHNSGSMHWVMSTESILATDRYVCDSTGRGISEIHHSDEGFWVGGANGRVYGTFVTWEQARKQAEEIARDPDLFGSRWMNCN